MESFLVSPTKATTDAYTDLSSLNSIKAEKNQDEALKKVAEQFESLFTHELLKNMRKANSAFEENNLFDNKESNFFRDMYDQQLSVTLSKKGIGLADVLYQQMSRSYGVEESKSGSTSGEMQNNLKRDTKMVAPTASIDKSEVTNNTLQKQSAHTSIFDSAESFVDAVLPKVKKAAEMVGVNPLILVAQAALETGWGKHIIKNDKGESSFNLFNIKADKSWDGDKVGVTTLEYRHGVAAKEQASFRKYNSIEESVNDFVAFIKSNPRYQGVLDMAGDVSQFVNGLQKAGYATDPEYANKIMSVYNRLSSPNSTDKSVR